MNNVLKDLIQAPISQDDFTLIPGKLYDISDCWLVDNTMVTMYVGYKPVDINSRTFKRVTFFNGETTNTITQIEIVNVKEII